jgi:ATP-dependent Clp protease ATP-binding subunit ClpC
VLGELSLTKRSFRSVLLRVKGAHAGVFLALEAGLHRTIYPKRPDQKGDDRLHVYLHRVALEAEIPAAAWDHVTLVPPHASTAPGRKKGAAMRERDRVEGVLRIAGKRGQIDLDVGQYWEKIEEIALAHLLLFEAEDSGLDRDEWLAGPVEQD